MFRNYYLIEYMLINRLTQYTYIDVFIPINVEVDDLKDAIEEQVSEDVGIDGVNFKLIKPTLIHSEFIKDGIYTRS
jgi:hypothetical protein